MDILAVIFIVAIILVSSIANVLCFYIGAKISQKIENRESIKYDDIKPDITLDPRKRHLKKEEEEKQRKEMEKLEIIMQNIENYDGTDYKQEDVPR